MRKINSKEQIVVGVNDFIETEESPLTSSDGGIETIDPKIESEQVNAIQQWRKNRDQGAADKALKDLIDAANNGSNMICLLYTSPSPRDRTRSRMPSSA